VLMALLMAVLMAARLAEVSRAVRAGGNSR
jgi:hypothetical protein